jgi:hypothetical protein
MKKLAWARSEFLIGIKQAAGDPRSEEPRADEGRAIETS